jgi:chorismate-pyruvate lyase
MRMSLGAPESDCTPISMETEINDSLLARTYRVDTEGTPLMCISEWFLSSLKKFLPLR